MSEVLERGRFFFHRLFKEKDKKRNKKQGIKWE
jgi:hypothetical protein